MKTNHIINLRPVGGDYFKLGYSKKSNISLDYYLDKFNINDYWIYKMTFKQKLISVEEFMDFKYMGYIFFKKSKYDKDNIEKWLIDFIYKAGNGGTEFLNKPLPPYSPEKIIIKK